MSLHCDEAIKTLAVLAGPLGPPVEPLADLDEIADTLGKRYPEFVKSRG